MVLRRYSYNHDNLFHFSTPRNMANKLRKERCCYIYELYVQYGNLTIQRKWRIVETLARGLNVFFFPLSSFATRLCIYSASYPSHKIRYTKKYLISSASYTHTNIRTHTRTQTRCDRVITSLI